VIELTASIYHSSRHELLDDCSEGRPGAHRVRSVECDSKILDVQTHPKAGSMRVLEHALPVDFKHATLREASEKRIAYLRRVHSRFRTKYQRFGGGGDCDANNQLIARLCHLPGTRFTNAYYHTAQALQDWKTSTENILWAPDHD